jgi:16S rRNA (guanine966-N2)-methyltransferase
VREAVFSALAARGRISGASVVDLFAGSGALGIEALSRGAASGVFVELDRVAVSVIEENLATLRLAEVARVVRAGAANFLAGPPVPEAPFALAFVDPPYAMPDDDTAVVVGGLGRPGVLARDACVVLERPTGAVVAPPPGLRATWERTFGDTLVVFLEATAS